MASLTRTITRIVLAVALILSTGCQAHLIEAARLNRQAQRYIERNRHEDAQRLLRRSFTADFENPTSHYLMAQCYEHAGQVERALYEYRLAVRFCPACRDYQVALATALERNGLSNDADEALSLFLKHREARAQEFLDIAAGFRRLGMSRLQLLTLDHAIQTHPQDPQLLIALADHHFSSGNEGKGVDLLIQAFKIDPTYPGLSRRLGEHGIRVEIPQPVVEVIDDNSVD